MTTRTVTAMFSSRQEAERAAQQLASQLGVDRAMVRLSPDEGVTDAGYNQARPYEETGFFASLKSLFVPDEDRYAYAEGLRRGSVLVSAQVPENQVDQAADVLEHAGALDLDQQEASWRQSGWTGYDAAAAGASAGMLGAATLDTTGRDTTGRATSGMTTSGTAATARAAAVPAGQDETLKVVEERLVVGKREVDRGRVRVRSYVVERPVEEQISLHEERVQVERHRVDRPATAADANLFQERVIEATAHSEEAVVGKEARVVEEIGIHKDVSDRVETVRDTVRRTEVEVDDGGVGTARGTATTTAGTTVGAKATGVGAAVDRTLGTDMTGTNPAAHAPDGTPGNPPGTMASRAVDKTLGTNISGANPTRKP